MKNVKKLKELITRYNLKKYTTFHFFTFFTPRAAEDFYYVRARGKNHATKKVKKA